jgi:hypothetical protein
MFYRVKVEERGNGDLVTIRRVLVLHVYKEGVEVEALDFELSALGATSLCDEVRWLDWKHDS